MADLALAGDWLSSRLPAGLPDDTAFAVRLCVEEALANVVMHAFDDDGIVHPVRLDLAITDAKVAIAIEDAGRPFDPTAGEAPAMASSIEDAAVGGCGLTLIRCYADRLCYDRRDGRNRFTMVFLRSPAAQGR